MGILKNPRHERFVQALFEGQSADEAYVTAGYSENRGNASRLKANESIQTRLSELQATAAKSAEVTVESLLTELEAAREQAQTKAQYSAAVRATMSKAQLSGLLIEKREVAISDSRADAPTNMRDVYREFLDLSGLHPALISDAAAAKVEALYADFLAQVRTYSEELMEDWQRGSRRMVTINTPPANYRSGTLIEAKPQSRHWTGDVGGASKPSVRNG